MITTIQPKDFTAKKELLKFIKKSRKIIPYIRQNYKLCSGAYNR